MRIIEFVDGAQSETTPTIGNIVASALVQYPDDATYEANEQNSPAEGNIYFNTTDKTIRYYNGTAWQELIDETTPQELQNKLIDGSSTGTNVVYTVASNVEVTPVGNLAADDVQEALEEHQTDIDDHETRITQNESDIVNLYATKQDISEKGQPNGYASLDASGLVPAAQLPSYVDDVLEYADLASFPVTGETGKIYVALDTNNIYRWSGSTYVEISQGGANQTLSNLTNPIAINQNLLRDPSLNTLTIGENANPWFRSYIRDAYDATSTKVIDFYNRALHNSSGTKLLDFATTLVASLGMDFNGQKGTNAADPTDPQDLATKAYVDANATGATSLDDLTDVDLTTSPPATGDKLVFDGTNWVPEVSGGDLWLEQTSGQSIPHNSSTAISYNVVNTNTVQYGTVTNSPNFRYTATEKVRIQIDSILVSTFNHVVGGTFNSFYRLNGVTFYSLDIRFAESTNLRNYTTVGSAAIVLNPGDYIEIYLYQNSGAARSLDTSTGLNRLNLVETKVY